MSWKESKEKNSSGLDEGGMVATAELSSLGQQWQWLRPTGATIIGKEFWRLGTMTFGKVSYVSTEVTKIREAWSVSLYQGQVIEDEAGRARC